MADPEQVLIDVLVSNLELGPREECAYRFPQGSGLYLKSDVGVVKLERIMLKSKASEQRVRQALRELRAGRKLRGISTIG